MQARLTLKDGSEIPLSDEVYKKIMSMLKEPSTEAATSIEQLEAEFDILFGEGGPSTSDLLEEHAREREHDERLLKSFR